MSGKKKHNYGTKDNVDEWPYNRGETLGQGMKRVYNEKSDAAKKVRKRKKARKGLSPVTKKGGIKG
jgi:hypothetical protein